MKYAFIQKHKQLHGTERLCRVMRVSTSGYYDWCVRAPSEHARRDQELLGMIKESHINSRQVYGSPRIHDDLKANNQKVGRKRIARLMKENAIVARCVRAFKRTTVRDPSLPVAENLLKQNFSASAPNRVWTSDITYIKTDQGWLYLAIVMDLYSRAIVGWSMKKHMTADLVKAALAMALKNRVVFNPLILHSDRGSQYCESDYQKMMRSNKIKCSMSGTGNCYDNAVTESFFHSLKTEWVHHYQYKTRDEARCSIFDYIEVFYNRQRRHSYSDRVPPLVFEAMAKAA